MHQSSEPFADSDVRRARVSPEIVHKLTLGHSEFERSIRLLERTLGHFVDAFGGTHKEFEVSDEELRNEMHVVGYKLAMVHQLLGVRLGAHLTEIVEALSECRTLSVAQSVRAAFEVAGAAAYYAARFAKSQENVTEQLKDVDRALYGARFEWREWEKAADSRRELGEFLRRREKNAGKLEKEGPPSVMTFIDALARKLDALAEQNGQAKQLPGHVRAIYAQLCDFVHPSVGTWKTYVHVEPERMRVVVSSRSRFESVQLLWFGIAECVAGLSVVGFVALQEIAALRPLK